MNELLRETTRHGDIGFPFALYHMHRYRESCAFSLHWHDEVELIYVQEGTLNLTIDKTAYVGRAGDMFMVNSREIHAMSVTVTPTVYVTALFPLESLLFRNEDAVMDDYLFPLMENRLRFPNVIPDSVPILREKIEKIIQLYHSKEPHYRLQIRVLVLSILCDMFVNNLMTEPAEKTHFQEKHRAILAFIQENYLRELPLEAVAAEFHMAPKYFSRYFKNTFHIALTEYINNLRLEKAADYLRHSDFSVTEIALQTGFNSSSYFNKKFRESYGKTPTEYRSSR